MSIGRPKKYVNDYRIEEVPKKNGKGTKSVAVYCGKYYRFNMTDDAFKGLLIIFSALTAAWLLLIIAGLAWVKPTSINGIPATVYVLFPYLAQFVPCVLVLSKVIMLMLTPRDMERFQYEDLVTKLRTWLVIGFIMAGMTFVGEAVAIIAGVEAETLARGIITLVLELAMGFAIWFFIRVFDRYECIKLDRPVGKTP